MKRKKISLLLTVVLTAMLMQVAAASHPHTAARISAGNALFGQVYR